MCGGQIEDVFSRAYNYPCIIDSIDQAQDPSGNNIDGRTTVFMHFINEEENQPVEVTEIYE